VTQFTGHNLLTLLITPLFGDSLGVRENHIFFLMDGIGNLNIAVELRKE